MLMPFQTHREEISPALRSHALGLSEAGGGGVQKGVWDSQNLLSGEARGATRPTAGSAGPRTGSSVHLQVPRPR